MLFFEVFVDVDGLFPGVVLGGCSFNPDHFGRFWWLPHVLAAPNWFILFRHSHYNAMDAMDNLIE